MRIRKNDYTMGRVIAALKNGCEHCVFMGLDFRQTEVLLHSKKDSAVGDVVLIYLKGHKKSDVERALKWLLAQPQVAYAEPDYLMEPHMAGPGYTIPNDEYFEDLWGMRQIKAPSAWDYSTGSHKVTVGVTDSGIDSYHPDLMGNMARFGINRAGAGWNFELKNNDYMDTTGHGTHVAGTIGAVGNNLIGVAGVCWTVEMSALKIGDLVFNIAGAIAAIDYANIHKIPILNNSWGGSSHSYILKYAIEQYDGLFVASAGNSGSNNDISPLYPASYDCRNILSVAASEPGGGLAYFSNYGKKTVDIAAPGSNILSTTLYNEYSYLNGTSMAAPHVSGTAALLKACAPDLSAMEIKSIILNTASRSPELYGKLWTEGILDAEAALRAIYC